MNYYENLALEWTFGEEVGGYLASIIDVQLENLQGLRGTVPGGGTTIIMNDELYNRYDPRDLDDLAVFIHEATHVWQNITDLYNEDGDGTRDYTWNQLFTGNLNQEEHAEAVEAWFHVTYGITTGMLWDPTQAADGIWNGWNAIYENNLDFQRQVDSMSYHQKVQAPWTSVVWLRAVAEVNYADVINGIRNPSHLPPLPLQNFPNPAQ